MNKEIDEEADEIIIRINLDDGYDKCVSLNDIERMISLYCKVMPVNVWAYTNLDE